MPGRRHYFVYILSNLERSAVYVGVTRDLVRRVGQHRTGKGRGFTCRYRVRHLVWFEVHESPISAISREKQIKAGSRRRKELLIEAANPNWRDLWEEIL